MTNREGVDESMIVNAFALCGSAEITDINSVNIAHAGIVIVDVPNADPDDEIAFGVHGFLLALRQEGDPYNPILTVRLRGDRTDFRQQILLPGWLRAPPDSELCHIHFPLQFKVPTPGEYIVSAHTESSGDDTAVAVYPLQVRAA